MSDPSQVAPTPQCVYVCAGVRVSVSTVGQTLQLAGACLAQGHSVTLLLEQGVPVGDRLSRMGNLTVERVGHARSGHLYFCTEQGDADRVFDTLTRLSWNSQNASIFFVDCAEVALTTLRARQFLGILRSVGVVAITGESTRAAQRCDPGTLPDAFCRWAVRYTLQHVDNVSDGLRPTPHTESRSTPEAQPGSQGTISVIIPLFNQGLYVRDAITSAVDQGVSDLEVVVVNDGSTDPETNRIFEALRGVTKVKQDNKGLSAARNVGIRHSSGDYVVPLDADDLLPPGFASRAREALDRHPDIAYLVPNIRYTGLLDHTYVPAGFIPELSLFLHTHGKSVGIYRRTALQHVGGYDENFSAFEDWELQVTLHRAGFRTDVIPYLGQVYRRHLESMTFTKSNAIRDQLLHQLLRKHVAMLSVEELRTGLLVLTHFWKNAYEPSTSVALQHRLEAADSTHRRVSGELATGV